jgi:hypothetical protein
LTTSFGLHADQATAIDRQTSYLVFTELNSAGPEKALSNRLRVAVVVLLNAGPLYRPPARAVENSEVNPSQIRCFAHYPAKSIDFADEMAFPDSADGGVAAQPHERIRVERDQHHVAPHPSRGISSFDAGMPGPDNDHRE